MVPRSVERQGDKGMHSRPEEPQEGGQIRQAALQAPQPHRDHVRAPQGLEARCHPIRPMPRDILLRHPSRRYRHLLAMIENES